MSRYSAPLRLGLGLPALRSITSTATRILPAAPGSKKAAADAEGNLRLIKLDDAFEKIAVGIDHRAPELLRQQPSRLVGDAELVFQLSRRHAVGMRRHHVRRPEPRRQRQFRPMHRRAGGQRGLATAIEAFEKPRAALQSHGAPLTARGTNKPVRPAPRMQKRRAMRLVGKLLLKLRERPPTRHRPCFSATARPQTRHRSDTTSSDA